jgi:hypothetical protein
MLTVETEVEMRFVAPQSRPLVHSLTGANTQQGDSHVANCYACPAEGMQLFTEQQPAGHGDDEN